MSSINRAYTVGRDESLWPESPMPGVTAHLLVGGEQSEGAYALLHYVAEAPIYPHVHDRDDESVYVLKGECTVTVGGVDHPLVPGSFIFMPRGVPHSIRSDAPWEGLSISAPGGVFDGMMAEMGEAAAAGRELDGDTMGRIMAKYGVHVLDEEGRWYTGSGYGEKKIRQ